MQIERNGYTIEIRGTLDVASGIPDSPLGFVSLAARQGQLVSLSHPDRATKIVEVGSLFVRRGGRDDGLIIDLPNWYFVGPPREGFDEPTRIMFPTDARMYSQGPLADAEDAARNVAFGVGVWSPEGWRFGDQGGPDGGWTMDELAAMAQNAPHTGWPEPVAV